MRNFNRRIKLFVCIAILVAGSMQMYAQIEHVVFLTGNDDLYESIMGDTLEDGARRDAEAVYTLKRGDVFRVSETMFLDFNLTLLGEEGEGLPAFLMPRKNENQGLPSNYFNVSGNDVTVILKNIVFQGIPQDYEHKVTGLIMGAFITQKGENCRLIMDYCVVNGFGGYAIWNSSLGGYAKITNCNFRNCGATKDNWSGGASAHWGSVGVMDSLIIQNNSFINLGSQTFNDGDLFAYVLIEHNTFFGTVTGFMEMFSDINSYYKDNIFYGHFGEGLSKEEEQFWPPFAEDGSTLKGPGVMKPDTITGTDALLLESEFGMTEADRFLEIKNSLCYWPDKLVAAWDTLDTDGGAVIHPEFIYPFNQEVIEAHPLMSIEGTILDVDPGFDQATIDRVFDPIIDWTYNRRRTDGWKGYFRLIDDEGKYFQLAWPLPENLAYTNDDLATASTEGLHLGDLNWFPEDKAIWEGGTIGVEPIEVNSEPSVMNYPNPFTGITSINYKLENPAKVRLSVFNVMGQEIDVLVDENQFAGEYNLDWDGSKLANSIYFLRLQEGSQMSTQKMIKK